MLGFLFGIGVTMFAINRYRRGGLRPAARSRRRRRREWILDRLSSRLDTTPSQDRVLEDIVDDLTDVLGEERSVFTSSRSTLADALKGAEFDSAGLDDLGARQTEALGRVQSALGAALKKAHATLDEEQRERLASFIGSGHHGRPCGRRARHLHAA